MAKFEKSHIVCECNQVSLGEIAYSIESRGAQTVEDIKEFTDAGVTCGCCVSQEKDVNTKKMPLHLDKILNKLHGEDD